MENKGVSEDRFLKNEGKSEKSGAVGFRGERFELGVASRDGGAGMASCRATFTHRRSTKRIRCQYLF